MIAAKLSPAVLSGNDEGDLHDADSSESSGDPGHSDEGSGGMDVADPSPSNTRKEEMGENKEESETAVEDLLSLETTLEDPEKGQTTEVHKAYSLWRGHSPVKQLIFER